MVLISVRHEIVREMRMKKAKDVIVYAAFLAVLMAALWMLIWIIFDDSDRVQAQALPVERIPAHAIDERVAAPAGKTDDDILAELCMGEAGNQPMVGKVAVVAAVLNRAKMFDKSVSEIVSQKGQFDGYPYKGIITNDCYEAVRIARDLDGILFPDDMIYFRAGHFHPFADDYAQIGDHYFSTEKEGK